MGTAYVAKEKSADGNNHRCATEEGEKNVEAGTHEKKTISIDLEALRKKFVEDDCPVLMKTLDLADEPIPLWWTADMINASLGKCWEAVEVKDQKWVVGEFNCSCVGISKCLPAYYGRTFQQRKLATLQSTVTSLVRRQRKCLV